MTEVRELRTGGFSVRLTGTRWEWAATREQADRIIAEFENAKQRAREEKEIARLRAAAKKQAQRDAKRERAAAKRKPKRPGTDQELIDAAPFREALAEANITALAEHLDMDPMTIRAVKKRKSIEYGKAVKLCFALGKDPVEMGV